jgi:hypothetical protein
MIRGNSDDQNKRLLSGQSDEEEQLQHVLSQHRSHQVAVEQKFYENNELLYYQKKFFLHDVYKLISINSGREITEEEKSLGVLKIGLNGNYIVCRKIDEPIEKKYQIKEKPLFYIFYFFFISMMTFYLYIFSQVYGETWIVNTFGLCFIMIIYIIKVTNLSNLLNELKQFGGLFDNLLKVHRNDIIIIVAVFIFIVGFALFPFNYIYHPNSRGVGNDRDVWIEKLCIIICMIIMLVLILVYDFLIKFQIYKQNKYILNYKNEIMYNSLILIPKPYFIVNDYLIELSKKQRSFGKDCIMSSALSFLFASFFIVQFLSNYKNDNVWGSITSANFVTLLLISIVDLIALMRVITLEEIIKLSNDSNDDELKSVEDKINWNYRDLLSIVGGIIGITGSIFAKFT